MTIEVEYHRRRGVTLLEVLISLGVLTIGLVSVVSLLPAGRSLAVKASVYDRGSALAANAAADLINRGFLRCQRWLNYDEVAEQPDQSFLMFDPLQPPWWPGQRVQLRTDAASTAVEITEFSLPATPQPALDIVFRSEDDPVYSTDGVGNDDPPLPKWSPSDASPMRRAFQGTYSYLATLQSAKTSLPFWAPATAATLTVVVFHRREVDAPLVLTAEDDSEAGGWPVSLAAGQTLKDVIKPGNFVLSRDNNSSPPAYRWHRVLMATEGADARGQVRAFITCEGSDPPAAAGNVLYLFPASVAALEMPVRLEGTSEWNR